MERTYSPDVCRELEKKFYEQQLYRPLRIARYDAGTRLTYAVTPLDAGGAAKQCTVDLLIERFAGGGFAGQVYKVRLLHAAAPGVPGMSAGGAYAMKILVPPSRFSAWFRNILYTVGFQGQFQLQCNPAAARSGALWQKFIRRAAKARFGDEGAVNDVHATFVDERLGSMGELSDWIDGRTWRLEVDDRMDALGRWRRGRPVDPSALGSPEYRAKKEFMAKFVRLLHEMGAHEFARQYEWWTCKSQPNCLKRIAFDSDPEKGLTAVDFRAGLALLPFCPMSPGDFMLIAKGIARGSFVQFDRGDIRALESFVRANAGLFAGMEGMLAELKEADRAYRESIPDITHNHIRLVTSTGLWHRILNSAVTGWRVKNDVDDGGERRLRGNVFAILLFACAGLVPFAGGIIRRVWGRADWRRHYRKLCTSGYYFRRALKAKACEKAIEWHRAGRVDEGRAVRIGDSLAAFVLHFCLSIFPAGLHHFFSDWRYARERLDYIFVRPLRLYFDSHSREQWLLDMLEEGRRKRIISDDDAAAIRSQIPEPFIQKYLKSLAVHVCTLPVTQVVSVTLAILYVLMHPDMPRAQAWAVGAGIIALFQVVPISPGSLTRGLYVLYMVIKDRNIRDYNIALALGFFKYVGYLSFPIQMTYRYPALARFMAVHWATDAVHIVPVFGEPGALLEHFVFRLFYNWPLTIRRRMRLRAERRAGRPVRTWHVGVCAVGLAALVGAVEFFHLRIAGSMPSLKDIAWVLAIAAAVNGMVVTLACGGASLQRRVVSAAVGGLILGALAMAVSLYIGDETVRTLYLFAGFVWRMFIAAIVSSVAAVITEIILPEPND